MSHKVLLVDDEPRLLDGLKRALRREPYQVLTAGSAANALSILRHDAIDVVVSDQDMPGMTGTKFLQIVHEEFPDTIRFMLTGKATLEVAVEAINSGAISRFFTKPANTTDLAVTILHALQHKDLLCEARRLLRATRNQAAIIEGLERDYKGISKVDRDAGGAVIIDSKLSGHGELIRQMRETTAELEAPIGPSRQAGQNL